VENIVTTAISKTRLTDILITMEVNDDPLDVVDFLHLS
jgi:hypothetical protein